jgi:DNA topoisomerase-1
VVIREGKYGKFKGCSNYPRCKWTLPVKGRRPRGKPTNESCPQCGGEVVIRKGKYGRFRACLNYPECEWSAPLAVGTCPQCGGDLVERRGKRGIFWGCLNYPDCRHRQQPGDAEKKRSAR